MHIKLMTKGLLQLYTFCVGVYKRKEYSPGLRPIGVLDLGYGSLVLVLIPPPIPPVGTRGRACPPPMPGMEPRAVHFSIIVCFDFVFNFGLVLDPF